MSEEKKRGVRLAFLGDIYIGSDSPEIAPEIKELLLGCDVVIANQESPICTSSPISVPKIIPSTGEEKTILLRSEIGGEKILSDWGVNYVTLANNHIFDQGTDGFCATINKLFSEGIRHTGAGLNAKDASQPLVFEREGVTFGIIAASEERAQAFLATEDEYGCNSLDEVSMCAQIRKLGGQVDHVIVAAHWGYCGITYPPEDVIALSAKFKVAGASLVIGHHAHVLQGYDFLDGCLTAFSLGNFYFAPYFFRGKDHYADRETASGVVMVVDFDNSDISNVSWSFTKQEGQRILSDNNRKRKRVLERRAHAVSSVKACRLYAKRDAYNKGLRMLLRWMNPMRWHKFRIARVKELAGALVATCKHRD